MTNMLQKALLEITTMGGTSLQLCLCFGAECDTVAALSVDRDGAMENKYCEMPSPRE